MKTINNLILSIVALFMVTACADNNKLDFDVEKPESIAARELLDHYNVLKTYVDKSTVPDFKLGVGVDLTQYTKKGVLYRMVNSNFNEISLTGNEMQHGTIIRTDGTLNIQAITDLLTITKEAGIDLFGSSLCSNENQNTVYLNNLIMPSTIEAKNNLLDISKIKDKSFSGWENAGAISIVDKGGVRDQGIILTSAGEVPWQLSLGSPRIHVDPSKNYYLSFYVKADKVGKGRIYFDKTISNYPANGLFDINQVGVWQRVYYQVPTLKSGTNYMQFFIDFGYLAGVTYSIDVTSFTLKEGIVDPNDRSQLVERTDEEKTEIIKEALDSYIATMMKVGAPTIKSWNIIDRPINDSDPSKLNSSEGKTLKSGDFYWQDYMGEYYAANAIEYARKHYAENGGNAKDLALFISESNLLDNLPKCNGLINYINKIEKNKGVTVDGISTSLKVVYGETSIESIKALFVKLASTGKKIRISKFEVSYKSEGGSSYIPASALTFEQQQNLSSFYEEILNSYFGLIPAAQCAGITYWSFIDNSDSVGLWTSPIDNCVRKYTYAAFANGLAGKDMNGK